MKNLFLTFSFLLSAAASNATSYYVSSGGNDANTGKSSGTPWKTIDKVNATDFLDGDIILFQGGITFSGTISKSNLTGVTFSSYGFGKAIISSGINHGIYLTDCKRINIKNLVIKGSGYMASKIDVNGLYVTVSNKATANYDNIVVDNIETYGYGGYGAYFSSENDSYGFQNVTVTNSLFHDNGIGGFSVGGNRYNVAGSNKILHSNIYVGTSKAYNNYGRSDVTTNWSGSGILISATNKGVVEYCEAYENGKDNNSPIVGPVGIWIDQSKYVVIQHCISHHNHGGLSQTDGGGFGLNGGSYGSAIQFCDSYDNDGYGYGFIQRETSLVWSNDTVRNCTSTNDAINNTKYGSFTFYGTSSAYTVANAEVFGNRAGLDRAGSIIKLIGSNFSNIKIRQNAFCIVPPAVLYTSVSPNVVLTANTFPCLILSIKTGSFKVKRIL
jgi:hypothetical protein